MIARHLRGALLAVAAAALLQSCGAGRFLAGAPSRGAEAPATAPSPKKALPAEALLVRRCSGCHELPNPAAMSGDEWRASLASMKRRMQLPASEWDALAELARP